MKRIEKIFTEKIKLEMESWHKRTIKTKRKKIKPDRREDKSRGKK
jgi:hypothetical protein